jgi:hypothetical protein
MAIDTAPPAATVGPTPPARTVDPPEPKKFSFGRALAWLFMILVILASLFPFYWMLRTALSSNNALYAGSDNLLPVQPSWGGFQRVFGIQTGQEAIDAGGAGQPINLKLIEHVAIVGDQWCHQRGLEDIEPDDDAPPIALLEHIGVATLQLRQHPAFKKLDTGLKPVGLAQDRRISRVSDRRPDTVAVHLLQHERQLADVARPAHDACIERRIAEQIL